ncbi:hypothetical protein KOW79_014639 [Hemibagrus wyckioides]|uniref:TPA-induced transmembrane protein n=1 Tax=Hemibagrus wyckioides TaxID=337641 RepID=A0A9D3NFK0_9TELE|nr:TPA-induced transmembrane protein [Hemibagrus wyckioides]KAG7321781.1 hypothetical protein KOW79_014639 [Hemibagrus wyckioides]
MDVELSVLKQSGNNNEENDISVEVCPGNGNYSDLHNTPNATEDSRLLSGAQNAESNGAHLIVGDLLDDSSGQSSNKPLGNLGRLKNELNESVCWKLKVWMLILIIFTVIILVIFLSMYLCSVHRKDVDDVYNVEEFVVPRVFSGNFTLLNLTLDEGLQSSLTQKLTHVYDSSFALSRYFNHAAVQPQRNSSFSFEYQLEFMMPKEHQQIIQYTLSKEMVYSVLLQQLLDEEPGDPLYIEPSSLTMEVK